nr:hypothetical protein [Parachlamydiaceae bacterium]
IISKKIKSARPREFEDIDTKKKFSNQIEKPVLRRRFSAPDLSVIKAEGTKQEKMDAKSGEVWKCIECVQDKYGGEIYIFTLKPEFVLKNSINQNKYQEKIYNIFPAVEAPPELLDTALNFTADSIKGLKKRLAPHFSTERQLNAFLKDQQPIAKFAKELNSLGYSFKVHKSGSYFSAPSRESSIARWEKLREKNSDLPKLDVASSEGVADDMTFVEAYFIHDALLSTGKEFLHDHMTHLIPTICVILSQGKDYDKGKFALYQVIQESYRKIVLAKNVLGSGDLNMASEELANAKKNINQMEAALGSFVDTVSSDISIGSQGKLKIDQHSMEKHVSNLTNEGGLWGGYWNRRFGDDALKPESLKELWKCISGIEAMYDEIRKKAN